MIPHSFPTIDARMVQAVVASLRGAALAMGPKVHSFEKAFARKFDREAVAVSSGTAALHLALLAMGIGAGDEVIIPTYVCAALLNAVHYTGATPVLCDVDPVTGNISALEARHKISRRTKVIVVPHMFGFPADMKALLRLGVPLIEDCAQSIGACYDGKPVGSMGRVGVFSFYATKMMATGEGGMVISSDRKIMARVRDMRVYDNKEGYRVRFNYKMTDMQAALGLGQLAKLDAFIDRRRKIAALYDRALKAAPCALPAATALTSPVYYRYVVRVGGAVDKIMAAMARQGVACARPVFRPLHRYGRLKGFPVAEQLMRESVSLPIYPSLAQVRAREVAGSFNKVLEAVL